MISFLKKQTGLLLVFILIASVQAAAQQTSPEMADMMRSNGKIYVVVTVALIVMTGILVYITLLDRKVSALEKKMKEKSHS